MDAMPGSSAHEARFDETGEALLAKAAQAWVDDSALDPAALGPAESGTDPVGSVLWYLRAYYHRVLTEDLPSPSRLAAVAEAHAWLGLRRPQGRALVQVREPGHAHLDLVTPPSLVVDIVTDDMPYLVDSVTTRLNRHRADIGLLVHPVLRVRRDVTGALREIVGVCPGGDGGTGSPPGSAGLGGDVPPGTTELTESWIHVEMEPPGDRVTSGQLEEDLRHVLDDVRVAVEDRTRMEAVARRLADDLGGEPGRSARGDDPAGLAASGDGPKPPREDAAEFGELLRWLADGNFTFLGYREYDLVRTGGGTSLRAVPGTGLGILRHARKGRDLLRKLSSPVAARAQDPRERLVLAKANSRSTVYRANYLDYVLGQEDGQGGTGGRGVPP